MGSPASQEVAHRALAETLDCVIVSVDYRLSPETPFPGALEDAYAGLSWVFANIDRLCLDPDRIGVMGESAGGGLAAALALLARDRGEYQIAFQHLVYPMLDDRTGTTAPVCDPVGEFIWTVENNRFAWTSYLGREPGTSDCPSYAAPARHSDLSRLPATFVSTGALDLFAAENLDYANRLILAGVPTELHVYPGAVHAFDLLSKATIAQKSERDRIASLRSALRHEN